MTILAWLRQVNSEDSYIHSEGVCDGSPNHKNCQVDRDYTLRMALLCLRQQGTQPDGGWAKPKPWCAYCDGLSADCIFCHTVEQLTSHIALSEREEALVGMITVGTGLYYVDLTGIAFERYKELVALAKHVWLR